RRAPPRTGGRPRSRLCDPWLTVPRGRASRWFRSRRTEAKPLTNVQAHVVPQSKNVALDAVVEDAVGLVVVVEDPEVGTLLRRGVLRVGACPFFVEPPSPLPWPCSLARLSRRQPASPPHCRSKCRSPSTS